MGNWKEAGLEAVKEFFRTGILGAITAAGGVILLGINTVAGTFNINVGLLETTIAFTVISALLRAVDRFIHTWDQTDKNGLLPW